MKHTTAKTDSIEGEVLVKQYPVLPFQTRFTAGRPTKITDEVIADAWEYLIDTASIGVNAGGLLPTKERLALRLGINKDTLQEWQKTSQEFSVLLDTLEQMQADMLMQNGLVGRYTPAITAILLSKHGYVKQEQQDLTSGGESLVPNLVKFVDADAH